MKRDMDLGRAILQRLEEHPKPANYEPLHFDGYSKQEVHYNVKLLAQAGLIEAIDLSDEQGIEFLPTSLTWAGHEFLEAARDEGRWTKAKNVMLARSGGLAFEVLKALLIEYAKESVGID